MAVVAVCLFFLACFAYVACGIASRLKLGRNISSPTIRARIEPASSPRIWAVIGFKGYNRAYIGYESYLHVLHREAGGSGPAVSTEIPAAHAEEGGSVRPHSKNDNTRHLGQRFAIAADEYCNEKSGVLFEEQYTHAVRVPCCLENQNDQVPTQPKGVRKN
ncbi:hypothetical protein GGX14DRAFT_403625 [Mycena pura]|uniref:Uncharacterized protein n=1 Tax=Mycena pura TaxID=153505 RepID=A0AAD6UZC8_9AGAR|nr:hypothetical protein GGX14DRAFT_403625 [Mycena pura]